MSGASVAAETGPSLRAATNSTLSGAWPVPSVARGIYFAGWRQVTNGLVDPSESALSLDPSFMFASGSDGGSAALDPQDARFAMSVTVIADSPADFPLAGKPTSSVSPNIMQKGLTGTTGGFWKMSLGMAGTDAQRYWYPFCTFKAPTGEAKPGYGTGVFRLVPGVPYRITCSKDGATATLRVTSTNGTLLYERSARAAGALNIDNSIALSVGHKPRSTDPSDSFAGSLADLVITKG